MEGAPWGGSEELWAQAANCLVHRGHQVFASVKRWPTVPTAVEKLIEAGVKLHFRPNPWNLPLGLSALSAIKRLKELNTKSYWLRRIRPDFVCYSDGGIAHGISHLVECQRLSIPFCSIGQANWEGWWPNDKDARLQRDVFSTARKCFFVSKSNLELFEKQIGMTLTNSQVVWNPFSVPWDARSVWPEIHEDTWSLACVGRLEPSAKGQDLLLEVLSQPAWRDRKFNVTFYGSGPHKECLVRLAERLELSKRIRFAGHVHDVAKIWNSHHALVLPSRYEGLPLAVVEAMLSQRMVIATSVAGIPEIVQDNVTGFLAGAPTVSLLAEAMERAWKQRQNWCGMGIVADQKIRQLVPRCPGEDFAQILEELCGLPPYSSSISTR